MKRVFFAIILVTLATVFATAQSDDYKKGELYVGYSNGQVDTGNNFSTSGNAVQNFFDNRTNFHGFETSGVYNVSRYVGLKADLSGTYHNDNFSFPVTTGTSTQTVSGNIRSSLYNVLGGVQIKDNANSGRFKPFAHALVGLAHERVDVTNLSCTTTATVNCPNLAAGDHNNGLGMAFGGGLDIRVNDHFDVRAIQIDYNPIRSNGVTDNNLRFGVGIVIK
jgi:hypothetical protein